MNTKVAINKATPEAQPVVTATTAPKKKAAKKKAEALAPEEQKSLLAALEAGEARALADTIRTPAEVAKDVDEVTVDLLAFKVGEYLMLDFKPAAKLKPAEGYALEVEKDGLRLGRGKAVRFIDAWKISEAISVDPPELKKATDALDKAAPLEGAMKIAGVTGTDSTVLKVDPATLWVDEGFNPREHLVKIDELTASIKANGFLSDRPITVRRTIRMTEGKAVEGLEVIDGHRRHAAAVKAEVQEVTVLVKDHRGLDDNTRLISAVIANDGVALTLLERAHAIKRLVDSGMKRPEVAKRLGKPMTYVTNHMRLLEAHPSVLEAASKGTLPGHFIMRTVKNNPDDHESQAKYISTALQGVDERKKLRIRETHEKKAARLARIEEKRQAKALAKETLPRSKAVAILARVSEAYLAFKRSRGPASEKNEAWVELDQQLRLVQKQKKLGLLKL